MNRLVYKSYNTEMDKENFDGGMSSSVLFKRLTQKEIEAKNKPAKSNSSRSVAENGEKGLSFNEWVRRKDAEKRMK